MRRNLNQRYGRWEARFRVTRGEGYSAAVLLRPKSNDGKRDPHRQSGSQHIHHPGGTQHGFTPVKKDFTRPAA
ncbi:hypothetical protein [Actinomadura fibrosa]|uniref:Transposase n=1 Tax=Actinomadura fibrosa TaxID=111802 RepID=A0ABW2XQN9_9ACTN|nr:hypothetical protein [Actinomadura fibrosa]